MSYKKAVQILPSHLLEQLQEYVDGEFIYIPKKSDSRQEWGTKTSARKEYAVRNRKIYESYLAGYHIRQLSEEYFLSPKSIERIIRQERARSLTGLTS